MAAPFTSDPAEVEARWRPMSAEELAVAAQLLDDAAVILAARVPTAAARVTAGTLDAALVVLAQVAMVLRVMKNPDGYRSESIDDWTGVRDNALSAGALYVTADEVGSLLPTRARARSVTLRTHSSDPL